MHNIFKNKGMKHTDKQVVVEPKVSNPSIHMVDVNLSWIPQYHQHIKQGID
jgi:hypothetical protein